MEALAIASFILVLVFIPVSLWSIIEVLAIKQSTHKIEYVPLDKSFDGGKDFLKKMYNPQDEEVQI